MADNKIRTIFLYGLNGFYQYILMAVGFIPSNLFRLFVYKFIFRMKIGKSSTVHIGAKIRFPWAIIIGNNSIVGDHVTLDGRRGLYIGNNVNISSGVYIWTLQHDVNSPNFELTGGQVKIDDYVWLSCGSIILPGISVGKGAVVAAGAVVTKDVEPYCIVAGVPARVIGSRTRNLRYKLINKVPFI